MSLMGSVLTMLERILKLLRNIASGFRSLFRKERVEGELGEELSGFLDMAAEEKMKQGMSRKDALRAVRLERGSLEVTKEVVRAAGWESFVENCWHDLRFAARMLRKSPGFTGIATLTLALGCGANTAMFTIVNSILLRPLPFTNSEQLFEVRTTVRQYTHAIPVSEFDFVQWAGENRSIEIAAIGGTNLTLTGRSQPLLFSCARVSSTFFSVLGVEPVFGRTFTAGEDQPGRNLVVILSHALWMRESGADPRIIGKTLEFNQQPYTVVGVMPAGFSYPAWADLWIPIALQAKAEERGNHFLGAIGRLKQGKARVQAEAELNTIEHRLAREYPNTNSGTGVRLIPLDEWTIGNVRLPLLIFMAAVGLVLLIACGDVAHLALARAITRQREMGIRVALGATRGRVIRQALTESLLLALLGSCAGLLLAYWGVKGLLLLIPPGYLPAAKPVTMNEAALVFTLAASVLTTFAAGLAPAFAAGAVDINKSLKEGGSREGFSKSHNWGRVLITGEVALAFVLLIGAGLLIRSFQRLREVHPGFQSNHLLTATVSLSQPQYAQPQRTLTFFHQVLESAAALPGVRAVAITNSIPVEGWEEDGPFQIEGRPWGPNGGPAALFNVVSENYFKALELPILRGRGFNSGDNAQGAPVILINESMAKRFWSGEDPVGARLSFEGMGGGKPQWREIIGVTADLRHFGPAQPPGFEVYVPFEQMPQPRMGLILRTSGDPLASAEDLRRLVSQIDPNQPVYGTKSMEQLLRDSLGRQRFQTILPAIFAGIAIVMALAGIYGVVSYTTRRRTREIGVRLALGASTGDVLRMMLRWTGQSLALGLVLGSAAAVGLSRFLRSLLYEVSPGDATTLFSVAALMSVLVFVATYLPARHATRVDPMIALRYE
jgi:putative ABC transport system permease protein